MPLARVETGRFAPELVDILRFRSKLVETDTSTPELSEAGTFTPVLIEARVFTPEPWRAHDDRFETSWNAKSASWSLGASFCVEGAARAAVAFDVGW